MPKAIERKLQKEAKKKHLLGRRRNAYVYGTLAKISARRKKKKQRGKHAI
jgi:hypothetical protein